MTAYPRQLEANMGCIDTFFRSIRTKRSTMFHLGMMAPVLLTAVLDCQAASTALVPPDTNSRIEVANAVVSGGNTKVLFWTHPDLGDPESGKPCPLNFYTVTVRPGLPSADVQREAGGVCGNGLGQATLLENGAVEILAAEGLEVWRKGKRISSQAFGSLKATAALDVNSNNGIQRADITPAGDVALGVPVIGAIQQDFPDAALVLVSLNSRGKRQWQQQFIAPGQTVTLQGLWASTNGGALIHVSTYAKDGSSLAMPEFLYFFGSDGEQSEVTQIARDDQPDMQQLMKTAQADMQKAFAMMGAGESESIKNLAVRRRADGGFDVLYHRKGGAGDRPGHFLLRISPDGSVQSEVPLTDIVEGNGLENWVDFSLSGQQLVLLSRVSASQPDIKSRRKSYPQNVISWIDLGNGSQVSRLVPLDRRYLEAAMNAGDEQVQYLENLPGGEPMLLTWSGTLPLVISRGRVARRPALRLDEGTPDLLVYTEAADQLRSEASKQAASEQRRIDRADRNAQFNADLAASVGMSPEEFSALSNKERKEVMLRKGDFNAMTAAAMKQSGTATSGQAMDPQTQAAMLQAQQAMGANGMSPEMAAQIAAAMAQAQQTMEANGIAVPESMKAYTQAGSSTQPAAEAFNMPVMDVFSIKGQGTLITGMIKSGRVSTGDSVCLVSTLSGQKTIKVEKIEILNAVVDSAGEGDVPGLLVSGIEKNQVRSGDTLVASCDGVP